MSKRKGKSTKLTEIAGVLWDVQEKKRIIVKKNVLLNQLYRDGPKIARHVAEKYRTVLLPISEMYSTAQFLLLSCSLKAVREQNELLGTLTSLLSNAGGTVAAALSLISQGYRLQPMTLLRNALENLAVAAHLFIKRDDLAVFQKGELNSPKTMNSLKQLIPPIGQLYGFYTQQFAHIGPLYRGIEAPSKPSHNDEAFAFTMNAIRISTWVFYVVSELFSVAFLGDVHGCYWSPMGDERFEYNPNEETIAEMKAFLGSEIFVGE